MVNKNKIADELGLVGTFKMLVQAYEEIAVIKMQRVRNSVLSSREYLSRLSEVFYDVKSNYKKQIEKLLAKNKKGVGAFSFLTQTKNGKSVSLLLSANAGLYGDIVGRVYRLFIESIKKEQTDIVIIGKIGKELFDTEKIGRNYDYFELPDTGVKLEDLKQIVNKILNYEKVDVFYGKFKTVVSQDPTVTNVSGESFEEAKEEAKEKITFHFEPSLSRIVQFFQNQVFTSLFKQTISESELAKFASRIKAMEDALSNIEKTEGNLISESRRVTKLIRNKKQIEMLAGISMWS